MLWNFTSLCLNLTSWLFQALKNDFQLLKAVIFLVLQYFVALELTFDTTISDWVIFVFFAELKDFLVYAF